MEQGLENVCLHVAEAWVCSDAETKMSVKKERLKWKVFYFWGGDTGRGGVTEEAG